MSLKIESLNTPAEWEMRTAAAAAALRDQMDKATVSGAGAGVRRLESGLD